MAKVTYELDDDERALLVRLAKGPPFVTEESAPAILELARVGLARMTCRHPPAVYTITPAGLEHVGELEAEDTNPGIAE